MKPRSLLVQRLAAGQHPDVVIIGGGCNGAGLFRDLALQGVATLLVDRADFSSGTSAAPTRLAHGGLKYLETGEISLVRESAEERNLLLLNAPHQVRPLPVWVPLRSLFAGTLLAGLRFLGLARRLGAKGALAVKAGLVIYDRFGRRHRTLPRHSTCRGKAARALVPQLSPDIRMVAQYYDARIDQPERLVVELIADGEADCPDAMAIPYLRATGLRDRGLELRDEISGATHHIRPRLVINTTGAWADEVQASLGIGDRMVGGTKGSHIVLRHRALADALAGRMLFFEAEDHRACLVLSLGGDRLFLGATDIRTDDPDDQRCSDAEIDYLFGTLRSVLPEVRPSRDDIVYTVAGVRPLPLSTVGDPGLISRGHTLHEFAATEERAFPVLTLIGGKWTTYRACAAKIADTVLDQLGRERTASTTRLPIGGGRDFPRGEAPQAAWARDLAAAAGIAPERAITLAHRYGSRAEAIAGAEARDGEPQLVAGFSAAELRWLATHERVTRLEDLVQRRTLLAFEGRVTRAVLGEIAGIVAPVLDWPADRMEAEIEATARLLTERHRVRLDEA